ncbi:MAG: DUF72 domain-containing protein [Treponema sp.]|nr:DUF72 domain-containing protein [Treponema sp.]
MRDILIGTSGYDYPEWKGVFYPPEVKRADFLSYYSTQFNALELNNTFYNMPTAERLYSFYQRSQGRIKFSIKANRFLTHEVDSKWQNVAGEFKSAVNPLLEKDSLSALLFQFPQSFHYTKENRIYLAKLIDEFQGYPVVIEFRHKEWIRESVFEGLVQRKASVAFCDMPQLKSLPNADLQDSLYSSIMGPIAYIRLHGRNANAWYAQDPSSSTEGTNGSARYLYDYSDEELVQFVPGISRIKDKGKLIQVYFNNHPNGNGAKNAKKLKDMLATDNI